MSAPGELVHDLGHCGEDFEAKEEILTGSAVGDTWAASRSVRGMLMDLRLRGDNDPGLMNDNLELMRSVIAPHFQPGML